jgi:Zn-dependent peptidase ImmA (M78 family)
MPVIEQIQAKKHFKLDFSGPVGQYFKEMRKDCNSPNSEAFRTVADNKDVVLPTGRRLKQFLRGAEKTTKNYIITEEGKNKGSVQISELAKNLGYKIEKCDDLIKKINEKAVRKYKSALKDAPKNDNNIEGFSISKEKMIFYKKNLELGVKNFLIAHELSHYLLGHKGIFFYRANSEETQLEEKQYKQIEIPITDVDNKKLNNEDNEKNEEKKKKLYEKIEYREEADRLAAILLMPYVFMLKYKDEDDKTLAERFQVPERAIIKRRKEVIIERENICFEPSYYPEGVEP